jgi:Domain of unknown function (DUF1793)
VDWAKTDWQMWAAALSDNTQLVDLIIKDVWNPLMNGKNDIPFSDKYMVARDCAGDYDGYKARPVVGGHFALMALAYGPGGNCENISYQDCQQ